MREAGTFFGRKEGTHSTGENFGLTDQDVVVRQSQSASFHWAKNGDVRLEFLLRSERPLETSGG